MKKVIIAFLLFFSLNQVYALELCTPSEEYLNYEKLSEEEKKNYIEPIRCKEAMNNRKEIISNGAVQIRNGFGKLSLNSTLSNKYNLMEEGFITSIKNQYSLGTCWAFSAISAIESNSLKNGLEEYDFSEAHMIYSLISGGYSDSQGKVGKYKTTDLNGGQINYPATYYFNGIGQLFEEEMEYPKTYKTITLDEYIEGRNIISLERFEINNVNSYGICSEDEIETLKTKILNYGAIQGSMYMKESLFNDPNNDYYISTKDNSTNANHGISIIGWDDTISKTNFQNATRDGAWIIKNSWGDTWSNDGIFYISYDDHFICKNVAAYKGVSNETYDNYYKAADVMGLPEFYFDNYFYTSAKFTKQSSENEDLKRVSFPIGENLSYKVYLAKDNILNNKTNWILLKEGTSDVLGIDSVNLNDITIEDDFTIITEYQVSSGKTSSILTMCNNYDDMEDLEISSNNNYYSNNGSNWYDFNSITVGSNTLHCEPNIYAYTNIIENEDMNLFISKITKKDENTINVSININSVESENISFNILNSKGEDVTSHFTITPKYSDNEIIIKSDNTISDTFTFKVEYEDITLEKNFTLNEVLKVNNNKSKIESNNILILIDKNKTYTYNDLINSITINNTNITITDSTNKTIIQNTATIGTDFKIKTNNTTYNIIIKGDVTGDGTVNSADLLKIVKYLKGTVTLNNSQTKASDCTNDNTINSADLLKIVKYLKGTTSITF